MAIRLILSDQGTYITATFSHNFSVILAVIQYLAYITDKMVGVQFNMYIYIYKAINDQRLNLTVSPDLYATSQHMLHNTCVRICTCTYYSADQSQCFIILNSHTLTVL